MKIFTSYGRSRQSAYINYATDKDILTNRSIFMTEIVDDSEISDSIHLRYNVAFTLEQPLKFELEGLFRTKSTVTKIRQVYPQGYSPKLF